MTNPCIFATSKSHPLAETMAQTRPMNQLEASHQYAWRVFRISFIQEKPKQFPLVGDCIALNGSSLYVCALVL